MRPFGPWFQVHPPVRRWELPPGTGKGSRALQNSETLYKTKQNQTKNKQTKNRKRQKSKLLGKFFLQNFTWVLVSFHKGLLSSYYKPHILLCSWGTWRSRLPSRSSHVRSQLCHLSLVYISFLPQHWICSIYSRDWSRFQPFSHQNCRKKSAGSMLHKADSIPNSR